MGMSENILLHEASVRNHIGLLYTGYFWRHKKKPIKDTAKTKDIFPIYPIYIYTYLYFKRFPDLNYQK